MKRFLVCCFVVGATISLGSAPARAADSLMAPLRAQWETTRTLVMGMAELIPEAKYDYQPTPIVRTFREQLTHIVSENFNYMSMIAGDKPPDAGKYAGLKTREEILKALRDSYDYGAKALANLTDEKAAEPISIRGTPTQRWGAALYNIADNMDHYGNLVVYARINGLTPPRSEGRPPATAGPAKK